jgi:hypothetical protein
MHLVITVLFIRVLEKVISHDRRPFVNLLTRLKPSTHSQTRYVAEAFQLEQIISMGKVCVTEKAMTEY